MIVIDRGVSENGPRSLASCTTYWPYALERPPKTNWKKYRAAMPTPMVTIMRDVSPMPLRRRGRKMPRSKAADARVAAAMPATAARSTWNSNQYWLAYHATIAPMATISPWAKFERPVVP
jgi:hypothetical protein